MQKKFFSFRKCIVCKKRCHKSNLIRLTIINNQYSLSNNNCSNKGLYLCKNPQEIKSFLHKKTKSNISINEELVRFLLENFQ